MWRGYTVSYHSWLPAGLIVIALRYSWGPNHKEKKQKLFFAKRDDFFSVATKPWRCTRLLQSGGNLILCLVQFWKSIFRRMTATTTTDEPDDPTPPRIRPSPTRLQSIPRERCTRDRQTIINTQAMTSVIVKGTFSESFVTRFLAWTKYYGLEDGFGNSVNSILQPIPNTFLFQGRLRIHFRRRSTTISRAPQRTLRLNDWIQRRC